jgi:acetyl/propionyl-CoA carboxylase alpha subunit
MFSCLLIANRSEIAVRVIRTIAVYSEAATGFYTAHGFGRFRDIPAVSPAV